MRRKKNRLRYFIGKLFLFVFSIFILSLVVFYISRLTPADPLQSYYGERVEKMSVEEKQAALDRLGLNDPIYVQYVRWGRQALKGEFGISYKYKQDVLEVIEARVENTLILGGTGFLLTFAGALGLGIFCAWHEDRWIDRILCRIGTLTSCVPEFWFSLVLILLFSVTLHLLPSSGAYSVGMEHDAADRLLHLAMPLAVVVISHLWYYAYMIRNKLLEEVRADYVLLGKAKGLTRGQIMFRHCVRNMFPSYISIIAVSVPHVLGGTYIVETVFAYPGIGTLAYESARYADYNMLMVLCMLTGIIVIFCSMAGQMLNEQIDPRIKASEIVETTEVEIG